MGRVEQSNQIDDICDGKMSIHDAHPDVQAWFELTVHNLAMQIVKAPKHKRKEMVDMIHDPWRDDVIPLARMLVIELGA